MRNPNFPLLTIVGYSYTHAAELHRPLVSGNILVRSTLTLCLSPGKKDISRESMIEILRRANELRFSEEIQNLYTEVDDTNWFVNVSTFVIL